MKLTRLTLTVFVFGIIFLCFESCKKKKDDDKNIEKLFKVGLNWRNDFEGLNGPQLSGSIDNLPSSINVKAGAMVLFNVNVEFTDYDSEDKPKKITMTIESSGLASKTVDLNIAKYIPFQNFSTSFPFPAEKTFTAHFTLYTNKGKTVTKGPFTVNVTSALSNQTSSCGLIAAPFDCSVITNLNPLHAYYFAAPYLNRLATSSNYQCFACGNSSGLLSSEDDYSHYALFGLVNAASPNGDLSIVASDVYKSENHNSTYFSAFSAIGINTVEMELINENDWPLSPTTSSFDSILTVKNLYLYGNLDTISFNSPVKKLTISNSVSQQWFKFRTSFGKKGVGIIKPYNSRKSAQILINIQR